MNLLAFETATEACSVALYVNGEVRERFDIAPRRHAELVLPWAEALLSEAGLVRSQLNGIAVGRGPGAFTGVRLAVAVAQGIALALDLPVLPVSTLAALAMRADTADASEQNIIAAIDARMGEVYLGQFLRTSQGMQAVAAECVIKPENAPLPEGTGWYGVGTGFAAQDAALQARLAGCLQTVDAQALPRASDVARWGAAALARGEGIAAEHLEPAYLRNDVALTLVQQQALRRASAASAK
jgi:tRNA threonylcarbamoyladenosine biosynthesis protein TsaB